MPFSSRVVAEKGCKIAFDVPYTLADRRLVFYPPSKGFKHSREFQNSRSIRKGRLTFESEYGFVLLNAYFLLSIKLREVVYGSSY